MFFYSIVVQLYGFGISIAAFFNKKAKQWKSGRKNWRQQLQKKIPANKNIIWFHCASLGEFEQGRPIMEQIKTKFSDIFLLVTFFSPSGYEIRKNTPFADYVCYLPLDTKKNARDFLHIVHPAMVFFIKYEFWFHFIKKLQCYKTPTFFISSLFRPEQYFFKWVGRWTHQYLQNITMFFVQNQCSKTLLESIGIENIIISGDTRFDRTTNLEKNPEHLPLIEQFKNKHQLLVGGSTWPPEEKILQALANENITNLKIIIAPHDISQEHIQNIEKQFYGICLRYSQATPENVDNFKILIIDNIGILNKIYFYADIAFIGGAFGTGLHNILEALAYGVPVFFGPKTKKFPEAQQAINAGCGFKIHDEPEFLNGIQDLLSDEKRCALLREKSRDFVKNNSGATTIIINYVQNEIKNKELLK